MTKMTMISERANRREIDLETATLEELELEQLWVRDEIMALDAELFSRRNQYKSGSKPTRQQSQDYYGWREGAVEHKSIKTRQLVLIRSRIQELKREGIFDTHEQWRKKCFALVDVLEKLRVKDLPHDALDEIDEALARFRGRTLTSEQVSP